MLQFDLNHQAEVMYAIHAFVDVCLNFDMTNEDFIFNLERLYCAFEAYKQEGIEYAASIRAFIAVTEHVDSQRGMLSVGKYISGLSIGEIKALKTNLTCASRDDTRGDQKLYKTERVESRGVT